jgi:DNA-binding NarL/FixJ family response regulator
MARSLANWPTTVNTVAEPPVAVDSGDAVTQRRILAVLTEGGLLAAAEPRVGNGTLTTSGAGKRVAVLGVDLSSPEAGEAVHAVCESSPDAAVVVVTPPGREAEIRRALRAGAQGIVFEGQLERTLAHAVRAVAAGLVVVPGTLGGQAVRPVFSHREREILALVAEGATNREIADRLFLAESTIKSHLSTAFTKLGVRSRAEAAALVLDPGEPFIHGLRPPPTGGDEMALGATGSKGGSI